MATMTMATTVEAPPPKIQEPFERPFPPKLICVRSLLGILVADNANEPIWEVWI